MVNKWIRIYAEGKLLELPYSVELERLLWRKHMEQWKRGTSMYDECWQCWNLVLDWKGIQYVLKDVKKVEVV